MGEWFSLNIGTIAVAAILACIVAVIIRKLIRDKRAGKPLCDGGCGAGCTCCRSGSCSGCSFPSDIKISRP